MFEDDFPFSRDRFLEDIWFESGNLPPARWKVAEGPTILGQVSRGWLVMKKKQPILGSMPSI